MTKHKTFIAWKLTQPSQEKVVAVQRRLKPYFRTVHWVAAEELHITAAFLGTLELDEVTKAAVMVHEFQAGKLPLLLRLSELSGFPSAEQARIIHAQVGGDQYPLCISIVRKIREQLKEREIYFDQKDYVPHLTLGRAKTKQSLFKIKTKIVLPRVELEPLAVYISHSTPKGIVYQKIKV